VIQVIVYLATTYISTPRVGACPVIVQMDRQPVLALVFIRIYNDDVDGEFPST
jgi:hypothetical protein